MKKIKIINNNDFVNKKKKLILNNLVPKSFENFKFDWIINFNNKIFLNNRNKKFIVKNTISGKKISEREHVNFVKNYKKLKRIDFILLEKKGHKMIGSLNLRSSKFGYEIGKFISDRKKRNKGIAKKSSKRFINYFYNNFGRQKIYSVTKKNNFNNIMLNKKLGFKVIKKLKKNNILMEKK